MSKFKYGEKIGIKNAEMDIEVIGIMPAGQPFQISMSGEVFYNTTINGLPVYLKESVLTMIVDSQKIEDNVSTTCEEIVETPKEVIEEKIEEKIEEPKQEAITEQPKRRGRKPKGE